MLSILVLAAAVAAPQPAAGRDMQFIVVRGEQAAAAAACRRGAMALPAAGAPTPQARKLADLPRAHQERTVIRRVDGCVKPDIVRYNAGK